MARSTYTPHIFRLRRRPPRLFPARDFSHPLVKKGRGGPAPPPDPDRVHPSQGTQRGTPRLFSGTGLRRKLNSCHGHKWQSDGGPPLMPCAKDPTPTHGIKVAPPFTCHDGVPPSFRVEGGPLGFHERGTPTPLSFPWEGGTPLRGDGGVTGPSDWTDPPPGFEGRFQKMMMRSSSDSGNLLRSVPGSYFTSGSLRVG